ncbi:bifunctional nicotinamide-nucleotide adenylyltransferase/Nudix hydroxylase [Methylocystis sp. MJC1]|jgi:bifunctional NMN adenylyltransferase/nudix hydrolase|uniref:bifunctional nicotinamide-nucleotide adenylyltransferase/Nudix hydroxylase n=1 Tax=Methylocystis sp. MJC1 TaxID=2654282 RepID=UPI0019D1E1AA|nr:bifunctional nicotinamide-nucleotide adenylyltransferase/Nudix hydroxylase [Methylocystis sp. MJC1]KAF2989225.1 Bifunctional NMN adenylyltransferase/Nudix hydrolase [Methylocystis sp. MJC1]MBU6526952.1 bifunctional nicotinamide-nucleotide adenylyltransferase/Nudix hydroxylase [Methylocystis sp. MJC1]UZX13388.1 bifunctional nicotinamide-nucleotide adenylyltransferase/Nudix hydroxylase [Methylocystis sp. MJC1]
MMRYDLAVFIGRFEPFHLGHLAILQRALALSARVVVLVGSAEAPRTAKNPWSFAEREVMIQAALGGDAPRVTALPLRDHLYNENAWLAEAQAQVASVAGEAKSIALFGFSKDASSSYMKAFPQWELVDAASVPLLSATELRRQLFSEEQGALQLIKANVPAQVFEIIDAFRKTDAYRQTLDEFRHIESYRAAWANAPYPPIYVTVDSIVAHSGHVLLVKRKAQPGRGLWALPGGFVNQEETLRDAAIRELREETRLKIPAPVLRGSLRGQRVFDHPDRSLRGRTITHAFYFDFPAGELPSVRGADDAARARWVPVSEIQGMRACLFEDHFFILEHFLGAAW